ncbi:MAG: choice-of-anchor tandem repeat GloVer-containing protein [Terriglobales bacterium]
MRDKLSLGLKLALAISTVALLATSGWAALHEKVLHSFNSSTKDGYDPVGGLIFDVAGNLYGTTEGGGDYGFGTVFELTPKEDEGWTEKVLHSFNSNGKDGYNPYANLIFDAAGNLYGTTCNGGVYDHGTVFELTPKAGGRWAEKILHNFNNENGACSYAGLIFDSLGNLYGTVYAGGPKGGGAVFELVPTGNGKWIEKVVHAFNFDEDGGGYPEGGLIFDADGNLYGATGNENAGLVFELTPKTGGGWTEKVLHAFNVKDGSGPHSSPIFDSVGNLYDTTYVGGANGDGTVFELTPTTGGGWTEKVLHSFNGKDGIFCYAGLVFDAAGNLYGTVVEGGAYNHGTVFELTPQTGGGWTRKTLHNFNDKDGTYPWATLILDATGNLYGTTTSGGDHGSGTVFEITP